MGSVSPVVVFRKGMVETLHACNCFHLFIWSFSFLYSVLPLLCLGPIGESLSFPERKSLSLLEQGIVGTLECRDG